MDIKLGPELFRFETYKEWQNKAKGWYQSFGASSRNAIAIDQHGRICHQGGHFMRARDDQAFPVVVYLLDCEARLPTAEELTAHRQRAAEQRLDEVALGKRVGLP